jgi:hypothetical protein
VRLCGLWLGPSRGSRAGGRLKGNRKAEILSAYTRRQ